MSQRYWPLERGTYTISSGFGARRNPVTGADESHRGLDFAAKMGTPIYAPAAGVCVEGADRWNVQGFGRWIWLDCQQSVQLDVIVGHCDPLVRKGDRIRAGQLIGRVNRHGQSTGPHAHVELWTPPGRVPENGRTGRAIDPALWFASAAFPAGPPPAAPTPTGGPRMSQLQADLTMLTTADSGSRDPARCQAIVWHTNEGPERGSVESLLRFCQNRTNGASYNVIVGVQADHQGRLRPLVGRSNDDNYIPWAAGTTGNRIGLHGCILGYAEQKRAEWLDPIELIDGAARVTRDWSDRYDIPLRKINGDQLRAGERGVCGHADVSAAWREVDHWDPGPEFVWDELIGRAAAVRL
ncbi:M23 family metallopeptidase [Skermania piniformis]|uniref:Peptidoglycan DD-metalloendopeptidase family protein n=1 Tax=Skermania pinensis TaxID=39122 RepID=A0ABX8SAF2_9ACTN|nr:M23 family metallopeptidase [Skermania piniformis]QXQ14834.1 peptidoglycan DD-metalloendopeptidase family protein [Skermania piniformis]